MASEINVHTEHCCHKHGCKYADEDCPVATGAQQQSFPCESCGDELSERSLLAAVTAWAVATARLRVAERDHGEAAGEARARGEQGEDRRILRAAAEGRAVAEAALLAAAAKAGA